MPRVACPNCGLPRMPRNLVRHQATAACHTTGERRRNQEWMRERGFMPIGESRSNSPWYASLPIPVALATSRTSYALGSAVWVERRVGLPNRAMVLMGYSAAKRRRMFVELSDEELRRLVILQTLGGD